MKALLVQPPIHDFYLSPDRLTALGLRSLIPALDAGGFEWKLINFPHDYRKGGSIPLPSELSHLEEFLIQGETGPISWFRRYSRFGPPREKTVEMILGENPDLVLISCLAWAYAYECRVLIRDLKTQAADLTVILGGPGASVLPDYFGESGGADYIVSGEAEPIISNLLEVMNEKSSHSEEFNRIITTEVDLHPIWSRKEVRGGARYSIMLTRGCPKKCSFCSNFMVHGRKFRKVPIEKVLTSIEGLPESGRLSVNFEDDNLLMASEYFLSILAKLKMRNRNFTFSAENGLDYTLLSRELLGRLKSLGLEQLNLSLAVLDSGQAGDYRRFLDLEKYETVLDWAENLGIPVITYFICGLEGDTPEGVVETLHYLSLKNTTTGISPYYPVPGLPGLDDYNFMEIYPGLCRGSSVWPWMKSLNTSQLITAFRLSRFSNLMKKSAPTPLETELLKTSLETGRLHTLVKKKGEKFIIPVPGMDNSMTEQFFHSSG